VGIHPFAWIAALVLVLPVTAHAQPREGRSLDVALGVGLSAPLTGRHNDSGGVGALAKAEYAFGVTSWFGVRPYGALLLTWPSGKDDDFCEYYRVDCEVTAKIALIGGKVRLFAPIPYIAPFLDLGLGASAGVLRTRTLDEDIDRKGVTVHIPFGVGLALGRDHSVEIAFVYFYHPIEKQTNGGVTIGLSFPLDEKRPE
jgi:hypothetical protein